MANAPTFMSGLTNFFGNREQTGGNQSIDDGSEDNYVEEEKEPGIGDLVGEIFTPPDADEEEEEQTNQSQLGPDGKPLPTAQQTMAAQISDAISKMGTPELPANFDPTDPKQLQDYLAKSNQQTALTTIQLAFKPMQMAMEEQMGMMRKQLTEAISGFGNQQSESAILKEVVPEIEDPQYSGLVKTLFDQAKKSKAGVGNPKAAAQMVRKGLDAMGIKVTKPADPFNGSGFKTGADALALYAPLPKSRVKPAGQ